MENVMAVTHQFILPMTNRIGRLMIPTPTQ